MTYEEVELATPTPSREGEREKVFALLREWLGPRVRDADPGGP